MASYVRYAADIETIADDEADLAAKIVKVMSKGSDIVREREGRALRSSHAKAHGLAFGELKVSDGCCQSNRNLSLLVVEAPSPRLA